MEGKKKKKNLDAGVEYRPPTKFASLEEMSLSIVVQFN
jgi:hypothetical protein